MKYLTVKLSYLLSRCFKGHNKGMRRARSNLRQIHLACMVVFKPNAIGCVFPEPRSVYESSLYSSYRYHDSLCPVEHMYLSDETSTTDEIW